MVYIGRRWQVGSSLWEAIKRKVVKKKFGLLSKRTGGFIKHRGEKDGQKGLKTEQDTRK